MVSPRYGSTMKNTAKVTHENVMSQVKLEDMVKSVASNVLVSNYTKDSKVDRSVSLSVRYNKLFSAAFHKALV